jgi:hypothetical protein
MDALRKVAARCAFGWALLVPATVFAQPPVTSPEQLAATRELFDLHAHGGHRSPSTMAYGSFNNGAELSCTDPGSSGERNVHYPLTVPSHLFLERVQVWGFDTSGADRMRVRVLATCQTNGGLNPPQVNILAEAQTADGTFGRVFFDLPVGVFGNSAGCAQTVEVRLAAPGQPCVEEDRTVMRVRAQAFNPEHIFRDGFVPRVAVPAGLETVGERP